MNFFEEQQRFYDDSSLWEHMEESYCYFREQKTAFEGNSPALIRFEKYFHIKVLNCYYGYGINKQLCYGGTSFHNKMQEVDEDCILMVKSLYSMFMIISDITNKYEVLRKL